MGFADPTPFHDYMEDMKRQLDLAVAKGDVQMTSKMVKLFRKIHTKIAVTTGWPKSKVDMWFKTENPMLGHIKPAHMILLGRGQKLKKFVWQQLETEGQAHEE